MGKYKQRAITSVIDRFWAKVDKRGPDDCWEWTAARTNLGYGVIALPMRGGRTFAHRLSAVIHFGMFDRRLLVCHKCDNPPCVNPDHLYLGTHAQNTRDMVDRGRARGGNMNLTHCVKRGHETEGHADCLADLDEMWSVLADQCRFPTPFVTVVTPRGTELVNLQHVIRVVSLIQVVA